MLGERNENRLRIGFVFAGGKHQLLHAVPVAAALARAVACDVRLFAMSDAEAAELTCWMTAFGAEASITTLRPIRWFNESSTFRKPARLIAARRILAACDALVVTERTSTILKRLPGPKPFLVHIPHGAGDRARGFERRIRLMDHVIVAGPKDRDRMIAERLVAPENCSVSGYIKLAALRALAPADPPRLFANSRPIILYNPHFERSLTSWHRFAARLAADVAGKDFNLIIAPHVRLAETLSRAERAAAMAMAVPGRVIVDLGSPRSYDMTYTMAADVYVGDVSSQAYEYLATPRPCVFLDAHRTDWRADPDYAFWHLGEVVPDPADAMAAIVRAPSRHSEYRDKQIQAAAAALGPSNRDAIGEAARIITALATARRRASPN